MGQGNISVRADDSCRVADEWRGETEGRHVLHRSDKNASHPNPSTVFLFYKSFNCLSLLFSFTTHNSPFFSSLTSLPPPCLPLLYFSCMFIPCSDLLCTLRKTDANIVFLSPFPMCLPRKLEELNGRSNNFDR